MLTSKFLSSTLGILVLGLSFSSTANAQLIRQEFEGNFELFEGNFILENTVPDNSDYSGFVLYSENGIIEDWEVNVNELDLNFHPDSVIELGLGSDLIPNIIFDFSAPSNWNLSIDFGIAFDAPRFSVEREASEITFTGELGLTGNYVYRDPSATITQTSVPATSIPEPGTLLGLLAVGGLGFAVKIKEKV